MPLVARQVRRYRHFFQRDTPLRKYSLFYFFPFLSLVFYEYHSQLFLSSSPPLIAPLIHSPSFFFLSSFPLRGASESAQEGMGATYGTTKSGVGVASIGVMRSELVMKSIVPVVMAQLSSGLACGLVGLSAGMAIGIVGNAGVRMGRRESKHVYHHSNLWCCEDKVPTNKGWPNLIVTYL
ncbi:uncharacterized protein [Glycine max]|uniref:uncharacterized protein isoform X1 n=1 Tax=Glycine max TaxID=3847 RepID=UPI001B355386|nr:uncharacterized protein LOC102661642 isoform X1 [Glycine max]